VCAGLNGEERAVSLITVTRLAAALDSANPPVVLDVRWPVPGLFPDRDAYLAGHIPGSRFVNLDAELAAPPGGPNGGVRPLPDPTEFSAAMRVHGVCNDVPVVVLDGSAGLAAGRAWWCLRHFGHPRVSLLDGGFAAWQAAGRPVATGEPGPVAVGDFVAGPGQFPVLDAEAAARLARDGLLLDARSALRYRGEDPADAIRGHIPGAHSAQTTDNTTAAGRWRSPKALRERFAALGVAGADGPIGVYCNSGVTACHTIVALASIGEPIPALYVGSWSEWSARELPVAIGAESG
jgi:thiosulfate/3-mercaptopyruvate sulfurtransferase